MKLLLATNNMHKKNELESILAHHQLVLPSELGIEFDYDETADTFRENSLGKALALKERTQALGLPTIADDSGVCVEALGGAPGVLSARFGSPDGNTKLTDAERNQYLLKKLSGQTDRRAFYVCAMVVVFSSERFFLVQETWDGVITEAPRGSGGFGYDPIFELPESGLTVAQISEEEKNRRSHRGKAAAGLAAVIDWAQSQ